MSKLLRANFSRLWKDRIFRLITLFMLCLGIWVVCARYSDSVRYGENTPFDATLFVYVIFIGCCSAIFSSMFFGTEYSDGTIRNKLIVGHKRSAVYLSNWIVNAVSSVIMIFAFLLSYCALGLFMLSPPDVQPGTVLSMLLMSIFTAISYASIFNMLAMFISKKSVSAVTCLLVFFALFMLAITINAKLEAPEFISGYGMTVNGIEILDPEPNPKYLQPAARRVYQFFLDLLPTGQSIQLSSFTVSHPYLIVLYSAAISVISTLAGIFTFKKKDLK